MKRFAAAWLVAAGLPWISSVRAGPTEEVTVALDHFVKALNAKDLTAVRETMLVPPTTSGLFPTRAQMVRGPFGDATPQSRFWRTINSPKSGTSSQGLHG
jgi:hypothetical protein